MTSRKSSGFRSLNSKKEKLQNAVPYYYNDENFYSLNSKREKG